jgi:GT2 family glycosyltransferase
MQTPSRSSMTIVIPSWNRVELLARCLGSLHEQTAPARVMVIDNGSSDGTAEMLTAQYPQVDYLRLETNQGFARAVNRGIERVRTPFLALLNNDTEAAATWVEAGLKVLEEHRDCGIVASRMVDYWERERLDSAGDCYSRTGMPSKRGHGAHAERYLRLERVLGASAGAAFYRREVFEKIGLFDESYYMYLEDVDLSLRARLAGFDCLYAPEAVVYHMEAASDPERRAVPGKPATGVFYSDTRVYWITRNRWQLMITYQPWRFLPWLAFGWGRSCLFHLFKGGHLGAFLKGIGSGIKASRQAWSKRRALQGTNRRESWEELWRAIGTC